MGKPKLATAKELPNVLLIGDIDDYLLHSLLGSLVFLYRPTHLPTIPISPYVLKFYLRHQERRPVLQLIVYESRNTCTSV